MELAIILFVLTPILLVIIHKLFESFKTRKLCSVDGIQILKIENKENEGNTLQTENLNEVVEENKINNENDENNNNDEKDELTNTYKEMSPFKLILRRFFRSKLSIVGLVMLVGLFVFAFLGPVVYNNWGETEVDRTEVIETSVTPITVKLEDGTEVTLYEEIQLIRTTNSYADPSSTHLLGTDENGMDVFVRLMYGGRISLIIGFIVVILETIIGIILGGIAGYFGGWVDQIIMRVVDIFNCIPTLPILLIASAVIDSWGLEADKRIYVLMIIITVFSWSGCARMVRGQILSLREQEFITATEVMGLPTWRKIFKHLIPNVMPQLIVSMTLGLGSVIL